MKQDRQKPAECPINDFYTLCDLDGAWEDFEDAAAVHNYRLPLGRDIHKIRFKKAVMELPFWRKTNGMRSVMKS